MKNDPLADVLGNIQNAERIGRISVQSKPSSKIIQRVLDLMKEHGYINTYEVTDNNKGGVITVTLKGSINKCGVIKPRLSTTKNSIEKFEERFLPAKDFGIIIISTPKGIMTHHDAKLQKTGGKLIAYCY